MRFIPRNYYCMDLPLKTDISNGKQGSLFRWARGKFPGFHVPPSPVDFCHDSYSRPSLPVPRTLRSVAIQAPLRCETLQLEVAQAVAVASEATEWGIVKDVEDVGRPLAHHRSSDLLVNCTKPRHIPVSAENAVGQGDTAARDCLDRFCITFSITTKGPWLGVFAMRRQRCGEDFECLLARSSRARTRDRRVSSTGGRMTRRA